MKLVLLCLALILWMAPRGGAITEIAVGWSENHLTASVRAHTISWRDKAGVQSRSFSTASQVELVLVAPRTSLATTKDPAPAIWLQRGLAFRAPTTMVELGSSYALIALNGVATDGFSTEEVYLPLRQASTNARLWIQLPDKSYVYTSDLSLRAAGSNREVVLDESTLRGVVIFNPNRQRRLTSINKLPLEDYLLGVIANEMPSSWPLEALKAQTLAARSYAVRQQNRHAHDGFDVCSTIHCQVYRGKDSERARTTQAVRATTGEIITFRGAIIDAVYHAHAGGHTRNSENVWGGVAPYLRGVPIPEEPPLPWRYRVSGLEFERRLQARGLGVTNLTHVRITEMADVGHVRTVSIASLLGEVDISAPNLRGALDRTRMRSTKFGILMLDEFERPIGGSTGAPGFGGTVVGIAGVYSDLLPSPPSVIEFSGTGFGHGVGMSQWGAFGLAQAGHNYRYIIRRFYQGVALDKLP